MGLTKAILGSINKCWKITLIKVSRNLKSNKENVRMVVVIMNHSLYKKKYSERSQVNLYFSKIQDYADM